MDARPSREQRELADAVDRLAHKLGPNTVGDLDDLERRERLDAALVQAGWRELRTGTAAAPQASGVEAAIVTGLSPVAAATPRSSVRCSPTTSCAARAATATR